MDQTHHRGDEPIRPAQVDLLDAEGKPVGRQGEPGTSANEQQIVLRPVSLIFAGIMVLVYLCFNVFLSHVPIQLGYSPVAGQIFPQIITYIFGHVSFFHLLFNAMVLVSIGSMVERLYGTWRYLILFLVSGVLAAMFQFAVMHSGCIGASGVVSAMLAVFARHYPREELYIWGLIPVPAWILATGWVVYNILAPQQPHAEPIAYAGHIGGVLAGLLLSLLLMPPKRARRV